MIFWFLLIVLLAQSQQDEKLGQEVDNLNTADEREVSEEPHGPADQSKSINEGHI